MAEVWDRKGSAPDVGQDRQAHYLFIPHHCSITARWVGRGVVARLYRHIRKPLMPIRHPIVFRGTAKPSVCSAWRLKVPKIEHLTHPKPYIVPKLGAFPKPFACFCLICSSRNPISCRNSVLFRNLLLVSALFVQVETLVFSWNLEWLCISVKPRLAFVISETCKPFSSLSAFSLLGATKAVLRV